MSATIEQRGKREDRSIETMQSEKRKNTENK